MIAYINRRHTMKKKQNAANLLAIDIFLEKRNKNKIPRRGVSLPSIDYKAIQQKAKMSDEFQRKQDEIQCSLLESQLKAIGVTESQWENVFKQQNTLRKKYQKEFSATVSTPTTSALPHKILCRYVTVLECQQKVCVDQPLPFDIDDYWIEGGGNTNEHSGPIFNGNRADYYASVEGSSYHSGLNYHRRTKESNGAICLRASTVLLEQAKVHQVGISFNGETQSSTGGMVNGLFLDGQTYTWVPDSYGDGRQSITFQVSIETPNGSLTRYIPDSEATLIYNDPPRAVQNYASPYMTGGDYRALPPSRFLNLNQSFPAGTFILLEARISHWIKACGQESSASVWHSFVAQPYINLESCSWVWPS